MEKLKLRDMLTKKEIDTIFQIIKNSKNITNDLVTFLTPIMGRINQVTGQENDCRYFAYLLQYIASKST